VDRNGASAIEKLNLILRTRARTKQLLKSRKTAFNDDSVSHQIDTKKSINPLTRLKNAVKRVISSGKSSGKKLGVIDNAAKEWLKRKMRDEKAHKKISEKLEIKSHLSNVHRSDFHIILLEYNKFW
jgi:hypothetical protein